MAGLDGHRILVVDDDPMVAEFMSDVLGDEGARVEVAGSGGSALRALDAAGPEPCLILVDLMMPGMSGWSLLEELQRRPGLSEVPRVVLSAHPPSADRGAELGAAAWLHKPVELGQVTEIVERYCAHRRGGPSTEAGR